MDKITNSNTPDARPSPENFQPSATSIKASASKSKPDASKSKPNASKSKPDTLKSKVSAKPKRESTDLIRPSPSQNPQISSSVTSRSLIPQTLSLVPSLGLGLNRGPQAQSQITEVSEKRWGTY